MTPAHTDTFSNRSRNVVALDIVYAKEYCILQTVKFKNIFPILFLKVFHRQYFSDLVSIERFGKKRK